MRSWKVEGKFPIYDEQGVVTHTMVTLSATGGGHGTFSEKLLGDVRNETESELVDLALESFFKSEFADRAMAESVQKIDELEAVTAKVKRFMDEAKTQFDDMQGSQKALEERLSQAEAERNQRFEDMEERLNASVQETTNLVMTMMAGAGDLEGESDDEGTLD